MFYYIQRFRKGSLFFSAPSKLDRSFFSCNPFRENINPAAVSEYDFQFHKAHTSDYGPSKFQPSKSNMGDVSPGTVSSEWVVRPGHVRDPNRKTRTVSGARDTRMQPTPSLFLLNGTVTSHFVKRDTSPYLNSMWKQKYHP